MAELVLDQVCNAVTLVGRVARQPEEKELPSGDVLVLFSVIVDRPPSRRPVPEGSRVVTTDTIDCVAWSAGVRRTASGFGPDDVVRVEGALQRRFWRGERGVTSKCEVEVASVKRLARAQASR
jgi:single-strand DNA-binding protein